MPGREAVAGIVTLLARIGITLKQRGVTYGPSRGSGRAVSDPALQCSTKVPNTPAKFPGLRRNGGTTRVADTNFESLFARLRRFPDVEAANLQAWDATDKLLLDSALEMHAAGMLQPGNGSRLWGTGTAP